MERYIYRKRRPAPKIKIQFVQVSIEILSRGSKELEKIGLPLRIYISLFLEHRYGNGFPSIAANDTTRNDRFQPSNREME